MIPCILDSCVWVDIQRPKTPQSRRQEALKWASQAEALTCEPVLFELRYLASQAQSGTMEKLLSTVVCLPTPPTLWKEATALAQSCRKKGLVVPPVDLLIVTLARHHGVGIVTSDTHYSILKSIAAFPLHLLKHP